MASIDRWHLKGNRLAGHVYDHPRFENAHEVVTSVVRSVHRTETGFVCRTAGTTYTVRDGAAAGENSVAMLTAYMEYLRGFNNDD